MEDGKITAMGTFDEAHGLRFAELDEAMLRPWLTSSAVYRKGEPSYYVEPISRAGRVYIFGGGHVGKALAPVLANVGFRVAVFDNRKDFAKPENYPAAEQVIFGDYYHIEEKRAHHGARLCRHHDSWPSGGPRGALAGDEKPRVLRRVHRKPAQVGRDLQIPDGKRHSGSGAFSYPRADRHYDFCRNTGGNRHLYRRRAHPPQSRACGHGERRKRDKACTFF